MSGLVAFMTLQRKEKRARRDWGGGMKGRKGRRRREGREEGKAWE